jgi:hypothetical protein
MTSRSEGTTLLSAGNTLSAQRRRVGQLGIAETVASRGSRTAPAGIARWFSQATFADSPE